MPSLNAIKRLWETSDPGLRRRLVAVYGALAVLNIGAWIAVLVASTHYPILLGLAIAAYGFGLRHAVDPDHIAAIDNTTRKLVQDGQRPVAVGFFFSLGHSTIVVLLSAAVAGSASFIKMHLPALQAAGSALGTAISGLFLVAIAVVNSIMLFEIIGTWRRVVRDGESDAQSLEDSLLKRGLLARILRPFLSAVGNSWNMYWIGFLFGLGFDTASEVALLAMAAATGASGMPVGLIMLLPLLFAAGMSLVDTSDGVAMLGAYGWAFLKPVRKLYYNITITAISIVVAFFIGGIELLGVTVSFPMANLGIPIVALFLICWLVSVVLYKVKHVDELDEALAARSAGTQP